MDDKAAASSDLRKACRAGDLSKARDCLARGARAGQRLGGGWRATALGWALIGGHGEIALALVAAGADPWDVARSDYKSGWMVGAELGRFAELGLIAARVKGRFGEKGAPCPVGMMAGMSGKASWRGTDALVAAAAAAMLPSADLERVDGWGMTPLMHAARNGSEAMVRVLLEGGADPGMAGISGVTPLMMSSKRESGVCALLLSRGADPLAVDESGATALHWAAKRGSAWAIALLGTGAAVSMLDVEGKSARERGDWGEAGEEARALLERAELGALGDAGDAGGGGPRGARGASRAL